ncbi:MAG TPA: tryptophan halogenase family protein [Steroidobacteraceae bacterium]|nr:tryptophan halogenase family protein [Steroidobacteraceae bacterium]
MTGAMDEILIVGGGTAGWLTAAYLAKHLGGAGGVRITLIESSEIPTIGVGEGTFPTIAKTLASLGIDEAAFMRGSSAAFKQGIRFVDWARTPENGRHSHYYHPFALPREPEGLDLLPYWLAGEASGASYADAVTLQERVCDAGRAPKRVNDAEFRGPMNYAYHLDAARFGKFLSGVAKASGVVHLTGTVDDVELDEQGAIRSVVTREHGKLTAGLYIDCTGFQSALLGRALGVPFRDMNDVLFVDRAVAVQVPHGDDRAAIPPYTVSTAHEAGWTWDIALAERRGIGYVYSSRHTDETRAEAVLRDYVGAGVRDLPVRHLRMRVGWRERHWVKNCVAVGLSGGFLEPLESTGIILIEAAAHMIASFHQPGRDFEPAARQFNALMTKRYERIVDFIKMHYFLTRRTDTAFWRDNAHPSSAPESLLAHLEMWRHRPPGRLDFVMDYESFAPANYQFVLFGMGFRSPPGRTENRQAARARQEFARIRDAAHRAVAALPPHRELLERVYQAGFSFSDTGRLSGASRT